MNDERPIEKLLRRAAQKRSAASGPPPELHTANRRLLQDEVARQFPAPAPPPPATVPDWWFLLKRRWLVGVGAVALLWIVALAIVPMFSKPKSRDLLTLNSPAKDQADHNAIEVASAIPPAATAPIVTTVAMEAKAPTRLGFDAAPSSAQPATSRGGAERLRPETTAVPMLMADRASAIPPAPAASRGASKLKATPSNTGSKPFAQTRPTADAVLRPAQPAGHLSLAPGGKPAAAAPPIETKMESYAATPSASAASAAFDAANRVSPAEAAPEADGGIAEIERAEQLVLARGGGTPVAPVERSSQSYSNLAGKPLLRTEEARFFGQAPKVLMNFRIEQAGRDMRVVDGDGSIYTGVVDAENTLYKQMVARQKATLSNTYEKQFRFQTPKLTAAPPAAKPPAGTYYFYRVEGTNRTLNQKVVFSWNFVATNAAAAESQNYRGNRSNLDAAKQVPPFADQLPRSSVAGRAQLGTSRQIEVNAVPVPR